jgi:hypothetical protein
VIQGKLTSGGVGVLVLALLIASLSCASPAFAGSPRWQLGFSSAPTQLLRSHEGKLELIAENLSDAQLNASVEPVTIEIKLPAGLTATSAVGLPGYLGLSHHRSEVKCAPTPSLVTCTFTQGPEEQETGLLEPYEPLEVEIAAAVAPDAESGEDVEVSISGGEAPQAAASEPITLGSESTRFGLDRYQLVPENEDGSVDTQAGSHPFELTSTIGLNQSLSSGLAAPAALPKDLQLELPAGLLGDPLAVAQCTDLQFATHIGTYANSCPAGTAIGVAAVTILEPIHFGNRPQTVTVPLFNLVPGQGEPARFGLLALGFPAILDTSLRSGGTYGVTVSSTDISQLAAFFGARLTLWGVPGDQRHDTSRGWNCVDGGYWSKFTGQSCVSPKEAHPPAFLTLPTECDGSSTEPLETSVTGDSWSAPGRPSEQAGPLRYDLREAAGGPLALAGCNRLAFEPSLQALPDTQAASTPAGLTLHVHLPQETTLAATGLAASDLRDARVTLPEGMQVNPAAAGGLEACSEAEVGFEGVELGTDMFTPELAQPFCPDAAKIGTVRITTPLLAHPLEGAIYQAAQSANPFGSLRALYIVAEAPVSGVLVKLAGKVTADPATGRLTSTFENSPQLPFEDLTLTLFDGPRAPLSTPPYCGTYTTTASFTPWSGGPPAESTSSFAVSSGPAGTGCADPLPFAPSLTAGSANLQAGAFTPFTMTMVRQDGDQNLSAVRLRMPEGLLGKLASVTPCGEQQAAAGTCGPASEIGHTVASVGLGSDPYTITGGRVFLTGPYRGAPYGLSIAEPAKAGPFDLGGGPCDCVVVRARIEVDPRSSVLTVASDPLPTMLQGIPLQVKRVSVTVDRPGFAFNPTNCGQLPIAASVTGEQGASVQTTVPFEVANCAALPFKPTLTALTDARTSKADGAYLHVKVTSGPGQANIGRVKVDLPRQLPSRLSTLQKACVAAVFEADPAACPAPSAVGTATARTPVLKNPLSGPAYLVSHGGAAFPDLEVVLQGEGITLILDGNTNIRKGITSSSFRSVPDAPISSFDLILRAGPHSALGAYLPVRASWSMCGQRLPMPTEITGQNGAVIKRTIRIAISGCAKHRRG